MNKLSNLKPKKVFEYFEEISAIPRGSGNMKGIADYCESFADKHSLRCIRDKSDNVIIYKNATQGYENSLPVILQGHLDMVCQKEDNCTIDFEKDGLDLYIDGDYIKARGTTLGADNGIAVAMIMSILASDDIAHPPIEALFTTDEETGMFGAAALDGSLFKGNRLINLDSEEQNKLTVSCAGGSEFELIVPVKREKVSGSKVVFFISDLKGGHSGIEIDKGRVNATILAGKFLNEISDYDIISLTGGDKSNAITNSFKAEIVTGNPKKITTILESYAKKVRNEIAETEPHFKFSVNVEKQGEFDVIDNRAKEQITFLLHTIPDGVQAMSENIEGLVETSLNLGILKTEENKISAISALRSNKQSGLLGLERKLIVMAKATGCEYKTSGHYPPWEFKENSALQELYKNCFKEKFGYEPMVEAIHAGLECGTLSSKISNLDAISIGPELSDVHTTKEKLKISSAREMYELVIFLLSKMK